MVQVPRFTTVDYQPGSMVPMQAPSVTPVRDFSGQQMEQLGQGLQSLGSAAIRTDVLQQRMQEQEERKRQQMQNQLDDARTKEAYNQLYDYSTNAYAGKDTGYRYKLGNAAITSYKGTREDLDKKFKEIENSLDNDVQKQMFRGSAGRYMRGVIADMDSHYEAQHKNYVQAQSVARAENLTNSAAAAWDSYLRESTPMGDPMDAAQFLKDYQDYKKAMLTEVDQIAAMNGAPPEARDMARMKATTGIHSTIIDNLVSTLRPMDAIRYLEANKDEIDPAVRIQLQNRTANASVNYQSNALAKEAAAKFGTLKERFDYINKQLEAGKIPPEVKSNAISIVEFNYEVQRSDLERQRDQSLGVVLGWVNANPGAPISMAPQEVQDQIDVWGLQEEATKAVESTQKANFSEELMKVRWLSNQQPDVLRSMTLPQFRMRYATNMSPADYKIAESYWDAANGISRGDSNITASDYNETVLRAARDAGVLTSAPGEKITNESERIKLDAFQRSIDAQRATLGDKLDIKTLQEKVIDPTVLKYQSEMRSEGPVLYVRDRFSPSRYTPREQMTGEVAASEMTNAYIQDGNQKIWWSAAPNEERIVIDEQSKLRIAQALRLEGVPATPSRIMMIYYREQAQKASK